jgi:hypothetical protein
MGAIGQNRTPKVGKGPQDRRVRSLATVFMSLVIAVALGATGCSISESGQTQTKVKPVVGTTHQNGALKVRIDGLCWSWESQSTPMSGETGAFSIEIEATIKNVGNCKLHPPIFSVNGGGVVSRYPADGSQDMNRGSERKLRIANKNQVHIEFNNNDPGKEILLTVQATDQWGEHYALIFTLPPPLQMPSCGK